MGIMLSDPTQSSRARLIARSRLYLAAVIGGGVVAGGGLTLAAAQADAGPSTQPRHDDAPAPSRQPHHRSAVHHHRHRAPNRAPHRTRTPVRTAPRPTRTAAPAPSGGTHSS
ncbi:MAG: hypothetical protein FWE71_15715 [Nocardioidaceae bacterium]|nr:hypothetical protein [Nocardioidaceae bacterium]MCL2614459.1 hypothetical protein [Nocardioidaceae bacterium]